MYLVDSISSTATTINLTSTAGICEDQVLVIDIKDANGNQTPSNREYVRCTNVFGNQIIGVKRGVNGTVPQAHASAASVECAEIPSVRGIQKITLNGLADWFKYYTPA